MSRTGDTAVGDDAGQAQHAFTCGGSEAPQAIAEGIALVSERVARPSCEGHFLHDVWPTIRVDIDETE